MTKKRYKKGEKEFDVHVWKQPESKTWRATYTLSVGKRAICYDMPIEQTLEAFRNYLEED